MALAASPCTDPSAMSRLVTLLLALELILPAYLFCQRDVSNAHYTDSLWSRVDSLWDGHDRMATVPLLDSILILARTTGDDVSATRALYYKACVRAMDVSETTQRIQLFHSTLQDGIDAVGDVGGAVLASLTAEFYIWTWARNGDERPEPETLDSDAGIVEDPADPSTWTRVRLFDTVNAYLRRSLEPRRALLHSRTRDWRPFLAGDTNGIAMRPTLFDVLASRALQLLSGLDYYNGEGINPYDGNDYQSAAVVETVDEYLQTEFALRDPVDLRARREQLLQDLVRAHKDDPDKSVFVALDVDRILRTPSMFNGARDSVNAALARLAERLGNDGAASYPLFVLAARLDDQWERDSAVKLCESVVARFPGTRGAEFANLLVSAIRAPAIQVIVEDVANPEEPWLVSLAYRNVDTIWMRLVRNRYPLDFPSDNAGRDSSIRANLLASPAVAEWTSPLPDSGNSELTSHIVDVAAPPVHSGQYVLIASTRPDFNGGSGSLALVPLQVSRLRPIYGDDSDSTRIAYLVDGRTGAGVGGATVRELERIDEGDTLGPTYHEVALARSLQTGRVELPRITGERHRVYRFEHQGDTLFSLQTVRGRRNPMREDRDADVQVRLTTDRPAYRPGQEVHFSGVAMRVSPTTEALAGTAVKVYAFALGHGAMAEQTLVADNNGFFAGVFEIPRNERITMLFIGSSGGVVSRPVISRERSMLSGSFHMDMDSASDSNSFTHRLRARVGDSPPAAGTTVDYRMLRWTFGPDVIRDRLEWWYPTCDTVRTGSTLLDSAGGASFVYDSPWWSDRDSGVTEHAFRTEARVVDPEGEVVDAHTEAMTPWVGVLAHISGPDVIGPADSAFATITSWSDADVSVRLVIDRMKSSREGLRERLLPNPDRFTMTKQTFDSLFPDQLYRRDTSFFGDEADIETILDTMRTLSRTRDDSIPLSGREPGWYRITISYVDASGDTARDVLAPLILPRTEHRGALPRSTLRLPFQPFLLRDSLSSGDTAVVYVSAPRAGLPVIWAMVRGGVFLTEGKFVSNDPYFVLRIPLTDAHRGNCSILFIMNNHGLPETRVLPLSVDVATHTVDVQVSRFRDRIKSGSDETWHVSLRGPSGEPLRGTVQATLSQTPFSLPATWQRSTLPGGYSDRSSLALFSLTGSTTTSVTESDSIPAPILPAIEYPAFMLGSYQTGFADYDRQIEPAGRLGRPATNALMMEEFDYQQYVRRETQSRIQRDKSDSLERLRMVVDDNVRRRVYFRSWFGNIGNNRIAELSELQPEGDLDSLEATIDNRVIVLPSVLTDSHGDARIQLVAPDEASKWVVRFVATTRGVRFGETTRTLETLKDLVVRSMAPRFARSGDTVELGAIVQNRTQRTVDVVSVLTISDLESRRDRLDRFRPSLPSQSIRIGPQDSTRVTWRVAMPDDARLLAYRVVASMEGNSDGESGAIPVLPNGLHRTMSIPFLMTSKSSTIPLPSDLATDIETSSERVRIGVELSANDVWNVLSLVLPHLGRRASGMAAILEQLWCVRAAQIMTATEKSIGEARNRWRGIDDQHDESPAIREARGLLEREAPWAMLADPGRVVRRHMAHVLADDLLERMADDLQTSFMRELGAHEHLTWAPGVEASNDQALEGALRVSRLALLSAPRSDFALRTVRWFITASIERALMNRFDSVGRGDNRQNQLTREVVRWLALRSDLPDYVMARESDEFTSYWIDQALRNWRSVPVEEKALLAGLFIRGENRGTAKEIIRSIIDSVHGLSGIAKRDTLLPGEEWDGVSMRAIGSLLWALHKGGIETDEPDRILTSVLRRTGPGSVTTIDSVIDATYPLLFGQRVGSARNRTVRFTFGSSSGTTRSRLDTSVRSEAGYVRHDWVGRNVGSGLGSVTISRSDGDTLLGRIFVDYIDCPVATHDAEARVRLSKRITVVGSDKIEGNTGIRVGDTVLVQLVVESSDTLTHVHLHDMTPGGLRSVRDYESRRAWKGLDYYEVPGATATDFYIAFLKPGRSVVEFKLVATTPGTYTGGYATLETETTPMIVVSEPGSPVAIDD